MPIKSGTQQLVSIMNMGQPPRQKSVVLRFFLPAQIDYVLVEGYLLLLILLLQGG